MSDPGTAPFAISASRAATSSAGRWKGAFTDTISTGESYPAKLRNRSRGSASTPVEVPCAVTQTLSMRDRKSVVAGKRVEVSVDVGGVRSIKKQKITSKPHHH